MAVDAWFIPSCFSLTSFIYLLPLVLVACAVSSVWHFYVKLFMFGIQFAVFCSLTFLISLGSPGAGNNLNRACKYLLWMTKIWGIKFNIKGRENIEQDSNYIVVCNHQSFWDVVAMLYVLPENTRVMMKKENFYTPFIGLVAWAEGAISVDRQNSKKAVNVLKDTADQIRKEKCSVWVYPEGTRHQGDTLLPFKKGAFHLAQQSQVPLLPMVISDYRSLVNVKEKRFWTGTIDITIFRAVSTEGLEPSDVDELTEKVRAMMCEEYEKNNNIANNTSSKS